MKVLGACRESSLNLAIRLRGIKAERNQALPVIRESRGLMKRGRTSWKGRIPRGEEQPA